MTPRPRYSTREQRAKTPEQRFWEKVDKGGPCWLWLAGRYVNGYGIFTYEGRNWRAHRLSYVWLVGEIPAGMDIDHKCHERRCVNPAHLQAVTRGLNLQNRSGPMSNSTTGVRGVSYCKRDRKWYVRAKRDGVVYRGGYYDSLADAEAAAIELRNRLMTNNLLDRMKESA